MVERWYQDMLKEAVDKLNNYSKQINHYQTQSDEKPNQTSVFRLLRFGIQVCEVYSFHLIGALSADGLFA